MDSLSLLPAAVEGGDWQDIRELVERTGEALRLSSVSPSRIPELAQLFLRLSRHENWQVRKAVAHAALYLRHDLFHGIIANLIDDDNLWVRDIARKTLVRRSELSRAEVQTQDPFDADAALLDEIESRYGVKARRSVVAAASKLHHRFVKEVYHEIIRILSPLDTCLVNLERELSGKPGLEQAADRIRRGHHHVGLITEVLDNLREFTDGKPAETTRECLSSILKEAVSLAQQGAAMPQPDLTFSLLLPESLFISGHRSRLLQAFINIITNAMEACEASGRPGHIAVSIERQSDDFARVMITDNGCGMSRDAVRDCVDLFSSSKVSGMGFGLPISRKVIEQDHSGVMTLESSPGEGTTVTVLLPIERLEVDAS